MLTFETNIDTGNNNQSSSEMLNVINNGVIPVIKAKAVELYSTVTVEINVTFNLWPMQDQ